MAYFFTTPGKYFILMHSASNREKIGVLAQKSETDGFYNIAFACYFQLNDLEKCLDVLLKSKKIPEASLFCRTYFPSRLDSVLNMWNEEINSNGELNSRTCTIISSNIQL